MIRDVKVQAAVKAAAGAAAAGRLVLAYRQNVPASKSGFSGEIGDMGEVIEAVERQGWRLDQLAFDGQQSSNGGCILLFRRVPPPPVQPPWQGR